MEKFKGESGIEKIRRVKGVSSEKEDKLLAYFAGFFEGGPVPSKTEREKTVEELEILEDIIKAMPDFVRHYGGQPLNLKPEYMHIIDSSRLNENQRERLKGRKGEEGWMIGGHTCAILSQETKLREAHNMVHEFLHLQSFVAFRHDKYAEAKKTKGIKIGDLRVIMWQSGLVVHDQKNKMAYFRGFDEAVIEELTMRFDRKYFPSVAPLKEELSVRGAMEKQVGEPKYEDAKETAEVITRQKEDNIWTIKTVPYTYTKQRKTLRSVITEIYNKNRDKYKSREEVFELFARATLSGRLLELARVIEKSLGKGAFRKLAEETALEKGELPAEKL